MTDPHTQSMSVPVGAVPVRTGSRTAGRKGAPRSLGSRTGQQGESNWGLWGPRTRRSRLPTYWPGVRAGQARLGGEGERDPGVHRQRGAAGRHQGLGQGHRGGDPVVVGGEGWGGQVQGGRAGAGGGSRQRGPVVKVGRAGWKEGRVGGSPGGVGDSRVGREGGGGGGLCRHRAKGPGGLAAGSAASTRASRGLFLGPGQVHPHAHTARDWPCELGTRKQVM